MNWVVLVYLIILFVVFTPGVLPKNKTYVLWIHAILFSLIFVSTYDYVSQLFASENYFEGLDSNQQMGSLNNIKPPPGVDPLNPPKTSNTNTTMTFNNSDTTVIEKPQGRK